MNKLIDSAEITRRGGIFNGDTPVQFSEDVKILKVFKDAIKSELNIGTLEQLAIDKGK